MKILVIDDEQDIFPLIKTVLLHAFPECFVLTALDGAHGIELAHSQDPDVILLDIRMSDMDGYEVCRRLQAGFDASGSRPQASAGQWPPHRLPATGYRLAFGI